MYSLAKTAGRGTYEEFLERYEPAMASRPVFSDGHTLLHAALGNTDPPSRLAVAHRLLDDGADAAALSGRDGVTTLHVLLGSGTHDFEAEAPLLERLLEGGADVNRRIPKFSTPLHTVVRQLQFTDEALAPFYDVLFSRPDLDLGGADGGPSYLDAARRLLPSRAGLVARVEEYLARTR